MPLLSATPLALPATAHPPLGIYLLVAVLWATVFWMRSVYVPHNRRAVDEAQSIVVAATLATFALAAIFFFVYPRFSRVQLLLFYALDVALLVVARLLVRVGLRMLGRPRYETRHVLILGAGEIGRDVARMLNKYRWAGLRLAGFLDEHVPVDTLIEDRPVLGKLAQVQQFAQTGKIHEIVVALPLEAYDRFFALLPALQALSARVHVVPDHVKSVLFRSHIEEFAGVPMIRVEKYGLTRFERYSKRLFDLIVGSFLFILALPVLVLIALLIRLDSPGPVVFKQERIGENGKRFWMYKFRSMIQGADELVDEVKSVTQDGDVLYKRADDPRITRIGAFIRRTSIDELPQLLNVLRGEMSLVGPRPELPWIVEQYRPWQWKRFAVPQGITGWWQVNGRSDKPMHLHTEEDLYYIQNYSLLLDVRIIWKTIAAVVKGQGAY
jgi:exopolysaccharide biosynthesis polyprenyl glycosylphosphotransferase